ncbi:hypothetical protein FKC81_28085 [Klebsiella pneumoniae]|nr:hypothetical protein FKC81_28085 [Klebsiella pneumoniae]TQD01290.1 hypothetical protein FKC85_28020 [Klebsiella pneumoniae]
MLCHGTVCVVGKIRDLILQLSKSSIYSTKPLMCRSMMLRTAMDDRAVLFKMPYIKSIYLKSTGGKEFDR